MIRYQDGFAEVSKLQITNSKYQMVRQAHHPELSRRVNHNYRSASGGPNL